MTEPVSTDTQAANSPAKQMLAALTRASHEMTKAVSESCDYVDQLNLALESKVNERLKEANTYAEIVVRGQLSGISFEKDGILAELSELHREELKVLQGIGKRLREGMANRLEELVVEINSQLDGKLTTFSADLIDLEKENGEKVLQALSGFRESIPDHIKSLQNKSNEEKTRLEDLESQHREYFESELAESVSKLQERFAEARSVLEKSAEQFKETMDDKQNAVLSSNKLQMEEFLTELSSLKDETEKRIKLMSENDIESLNGVLEPFKKSSLEMADIQKELHATVVHNLALEYRTEFFSLAKETEDQARNAKAEIQTSLNSQRDAFTEESDKLLFAFDKNLREIPVDNSSGSKASSNDYAQKVKQILNDLRSKISDSADEKVSSIEESLTTSHDKFAQQLAAIAKKTHDQIDHNLKTVLDESAAIQKENEQQHARLEEKMQSLELLIDEARELINALGDGLEFEE